MPRKLEFATGGSGAGAEGKKINVVYPPEVQRKLDDALGVAEKAGSAACLRRQAERVAALKAYQQLIEKEAEQVKLVDFRGEKIHNFELQALKKIVEQINEDYAEQGKADPGFEQEDVEIEDLEVEVEEGKVEGINLDCSKLKKIPEAIGRLTNLLSLLLRSNQIIEISGLDNLTNLQVLDLLDNKITKVGGLGKLTGLRLVWLLENPVDKCVSSNREELERLRKSGVKVEI